MINLQIFAHAFVQLRAKERKSNKERVRFEDPKCNLTNFLENLSRQGLSCFEQGGGEVESTLTSL